MAKVHRLKDLDPAWLVEPLTKDSVHTSSMEELGVRKPIGMRFICPVCPSGHMQQVFFKGVPPDLNWNPSKATWEVSGTSSWDTVTLHPSVNTRCWHGWVKNGEVS